MFWELHLATLKFPCLGEPADSSVPEGKPCISPTLLPELCIPPPPLPTPVFLTQARVKPKAENKTEGKQTHVRANGQQQREA